ncbi:MAG: PQQ-binding-like beta-propeller repeat protein, partial [Phycisphaerales bacterium]|nr:PQQ-binding-like beta-propeller repeat protein [Phycisphaerales bacterium]
ATTWSAEDNIVWKTPLPSWSGATPVIHGERIFLTSPSAGDVGGPGNERRPGGDNLLLMCLDRRTGAVRWTETIDSGNTLHRKGNSTSPSPVTDGAHVWAVTGNGVVTCRDLDGREVWGRNIQEDYGNFGLNWGYASSPLLHEGVLYIEVLHGFYTDEPSYVMAIDATTGEVRWRVERPTDAPREAPDAYTTPVLLEHGGAMQLVVTGGDYVTAHDLKTGHEIWRAGGLNPTRSDWFRIVASPLAVDGMVYVPTRVKPLHAFRAGGEGLVTESHLAWTFDGRAGPDVPTPACDGSRLYIVNDQGLATCLDARTGETIWGPERTVRGTVSSSVLLADGKLYITNEDSTTVVLRAGDEFEILAENTLDGSYTLSSPIAAGSAIFIRTGTHLYCIDDAAE